MSRLDELAGRVIPDRVGRSFFRLLVWFSIMVALFGPLIGAATYFAFGLAFVPTYLRLLLANLIGITVGGVVTALLIRRRRTPGIPLRSALGYTAAYAIIAGLVRFAIFLAMGIGGRGPINLGIQSTIYLVIFAFVAAASVYASEREEAIEASFIEVTRTQQALAHEEESVRGRVFDQLHGSVQAEIVAVRRALDDLAATTSDPRAGEQARRLEARLDDIYQSSIRTIAVALSPAGLDAGLIPALRELAIRLEGATEVKLDIDPVVTILDDPTRGGIHRQVRIAAFRIVEEAVANALRHALAREVDVRVSSRLDGTSAVLILQVRNATDGTITITEGEGLRRMRARTESVGGSLEVRAQGDAVEVIAHLPLMRQDEGRFLP